MVCANAAVDVPSGVLHTMCLSEISYKVAYSLFTGCKVSDSIPRPADLPAAADFVFWVAAHHDDHDGHAPMVCMQPALTKVWAPVS